MLEVAGKKKEIETVETITINKSEYVLKTAKSEYADIISQIAFHNQQLIELQNLARSKESEIVELIAKG